MMSNNNRLVSVLPLISKICEEIMYTRLMELINKHDILLKCQFEFRRGMETNSAMIILIVSAIDNGDSVIVVLFYLSKAFDTVNHTILLEKKNWN